MHACGRDGHRWQVSRVSKTTGVVGVPQHMLTAAPPRLMRGTGSMCVRLENGAAQAPAWAPGPGLMGLAACLLPERRQACRLHARIGSRAAADVWEPMCARPSAPVHVWCMLAVAPQAVADWQQNVEHRMRSPPRDGGQHTYTNTCSTATWHTGWQLHHVHQLHPLPSTPPLYPSAPSSRWCWSSRAAASSTLAPTTMAAPKRIEARGRDTHSNA